MDLLDLQIAQCKKRLGPSKTSSWQKVLGDYLLTWGGDTLNQTRTLSIADYHLYREQLYVVLARQWMTLFTDTNFEELEPLTVNQNIDAQTLGRWNSLFPPNGKQKRQVFVLPVDTVLATMQSSLETTQPPVFVPEPLEPDSITEAVLADMGKCWGLADESQREELIQWAKHRQFWSMPSSKERVERQSVRRMQALVNTVVFKRPWSGEPTHTGLFWQAEPQVLVSYPIRIKRAREETAEAPTQIVQYQAPRPRRLHLPPPVPVHRFPPFHPLWQPPNACEHKSR